MSGQDESPEPGTATIEDLSRAILAWLDERPPGLVRRSASLSWTSRELRSSFLVNLDQALRATVEAARWSEAIIYLVNKFTVRSPGDLTRTSQWPVALRQGSAPDTFRAMRGDITELLRPDPGEGPSPAPPPDTLAKVIVTALNKALEAEAARSPTGGGSPISVLRQFMVPDAIRKKYNVRLFLFFLGLCIPIFVIYAFADTNSWFNPATALFVILGYATLVTTALVHERTNGAVE